MFNALVHHIQHHPESAFLLGFGITFLESLPVIGHFLPGFMTVPPFGWLIAQQILPPIQTVLFLFLGCLTGDIFCYSLGYYNQKIVRERLLPRYPKITKKMDILIQDYGIFAVIIGRFSGPVRSFVPLLSGLFRMQPKSFALTSIFAISLWLTLHLLPGFLLAWYHLNLSFHSEIVTDISGITTALVLCFVIATQRYSAHKAIKMLALSEASLPLCRAVIAYLGYSLLFLNVVFLLKHGSFSTLNIICYQYLVALHRLLGLQVAMLVSFIGDVESISLLSLVISGWLYYQGRKTQASFIALALVYVFGMCSLVKLVIHHPRPEHVRSFLSAYSFPSGHVALSTMLSFCLLHTGLIRQHFMAYLTIILWLGMVAISRIYLGAHWLADVTGGWLLGISSLYFAHIVRYFLPSMLCSGPLLRSHSQAKLILIGYVSVIIIFMYWSNPDIQVYMLP